MAWPGLVALAFLAGKPALADCILDAWDDPTSPAADIQTVFPNWQKTPVATFAIEEDTDANEPLCTNGPITGLTVFNYGTATGGPGADLTGAYFTIECGGTNSGVLPLTFAGIWNVVGPSYPAWTWSGSIPWVADPTTACGGTPELHLYVDVGPCPGEGHTVQMGPGYDSAGDPSIVDACTATLGCGAGTGALPTSLIQTIHYVLKESDSTDAAPGDTINYTIYYGRPGTGSLTTETIFDSMPAYTHLVTTGLPAPDPGWNPNAGPPMQLQWTIPGPIATAGGATGAVTFGVTVDWGNQESFEPGSGDVAAPEGTFLANRAALAWAPSGGCGFTGMPSNQATTVVRRFLFWLVGDNDVLFSQTYGQPPDDMIYSVYVANTSVTKTWWNVQIWDTVPTILDTWCVGCGLEDPCVGWTMTPSGCAAASPGQIQTGGGKTMLTWKLDMPPSMTMTLRWHAQVLPTVSSGQTAVNVLSIREYGRSGVVAGTGDSVVTKTFTHLALVVLPTTYVSYVGYAGASPDTKALGCRGFHISFYPLNKKVQFELRAIEYQALPWSTNGGVSDTIGCLIGDCLGGFPGAGTCALGSGIVYGGGFGGCKAERAPAKYDPAFWQTTCPAFPFENIYKITSNAPVLWQLLTYMTQVGDDYHTYAPATTLTYLGMAHYMWRAYDNTATTVPFGMSLTMINTGADPYGVYKPAQPTTVHLFKWDLISLTWIYQRSWDIDGESVAYDMGTDATDDGPWRTLSSDTQLIINQGMNTNSNLSCCCGACANDFGHLMPTRETGNLISGIGYGTFYGVVQGYNSTGWPKVVIGNCGLTNAAFDIYRYVPNAPLVPPTVPSQLAGNTGGWASVGSGAVGAGIANATNPQIYPIGSGQFDSSSLSVFKIVVTAGGPIQIQSGQFSQRSCAGGSMLHSSQGGNTGTDFWFHEAPNEPGSGGCLCGSGTGGGFTPTQTLSFFCPKKGMVVTMASQDGAAATYTTSGPDQCVSFTNITMINAPGSRNWHITSIPGGGNMIGQYIQCNVSQKGYTAPFLVSGTHYSLIVPTTVFVGQSFWITVVVVDASASTKNDYCGTTSFTSTDPAAKINGLAMDGFNYTWSSLVGGCGSSPYDNGVHIFLNVSFSRLGLTAIVATDTIDGSITGVGTIMVVGADVKLTKRPPLSVAASGDTIQFKVCWSNYSSASAFSFVITDAIPQGMTYVPEVPSVMDCGNTDGVPLTEAYSTVPQATPPAMTTLTVAAPPNTTQWLRWTVPTVGVGTTGCGCYRVTVN